MTAESAVMNKLGVALAADSAVTVSNRDADKVYSSSDKLFQLSDTAPVAIMKSGNADFLGMPWNVLISVYRKQLGNTTFPRLSDYATDFFRFVSKFVRTDATVFPRSVQDAWVENYAENVLINVLVDVKHRCEQEENPAQSDKRKQIVIHEVATEFLKEKREDSQLPRFGVASARTLRARYGKTVKKEIREFFEDFSLPSLPTKTSRLLETLIFESILRTNPDSDSRTNFDSSATNIVFAGFGEEEYLPAYLKYAVDGWDDNKLRHYRSEEGKISPEKSGDVGLFGQYNPAYSVAIGVNPDFLFDMLMHMLNGVDEFTEKMMKTFARVTGHEYTARETKKLGLIADEHREDLLKWVTEYSEECEEKLYDAVGHLPTSELATAAEMLVNITKFRQRVSAEQETVGGPIDVALITKGDGFVWVKKKQYFPAKTEQAGKNDPRVPRMR
ncbi:MAG: hypothetical protein OXU88_07400 [Gammaproteobacteria bacterium]|nr:hypothetical protein [Gammaproteobacteria bacterium]